MFAWSSEGGRGCFDEEFLSALFSLAREKGEELIRAEEIGLRLVWFSREGTRLLYSREVPGGVAHCWRDDDEMIVLYVC